MSSTEPPKKRGRKALPEHTRKGSSLKLACSGAELEGYKALAARYNLPLSEFVRRAIQNVAQFGFAEAL